MNHLHSEMTGHRLELLEDGGILLAHVKLYTYDTAITANVTTTTADAGSLGATTNATGRGKLFASDGSKWQNFSPGTAIADAVAAASAATAAALTGTLTGTTDGALADVAAAAGNCAGNAEPSAANVDSAIATAVAPIVTGVNTQNKEMQAQINALITDAASIRTQLNLVITKLKASGQMTS